jgi:hypothetical protein
MVRHSVCNALLSGFGAAMDAEFEAQAELFVSLKNAGFKVNGEVPFKDSAGKRKRADIVVWCDPSKLAIEVKRHDTEVTHTQMCGYADAFEHVVTVCGLQQTRELIRVLCDIGPEQLSDFLRAHGATPLQSNTVPSGDMLQSRYGQERAVMAMSQLLSPRWFIIVDAESGEERQVQASTHDDAVDAMLRHEHRAQASFQVWGENEASAVSVFCKRETRWSIVKRK